MSNMNVSTIGIGEGIDYLGTQFIAPLKDNVDEIMNTYSSFEQQGILSSANINSIVGEIKSRISILESNFTTLSDNLKKGMYQSQEEIEAHRSAMENQMNQGA